MATITTQMVITGTNTYSIAADDTLDVTGAAAILWSGTGASITFTNNGFITDADDQAFLLADTLPTGTLTFNNALGATVDSEMKFEDLADATVTINNDGLISGRDKNALELSTAGATFVVNNNATGVMTQGEAGSDIIKNASNLTLNNSGKIISSGDTMGPDGEATDTGGDAIDLGDGTNNEINNLDGGIIEGSKHGITGDVGATITNEESGLISGRNGSGVNFDNYYEDAGELEAARLTIVNHGVITGNSKTYADSDGDAIDADGLVTVDNYGFVGGMGDHGTKDGSDNHAEGIAAGGGIINNHKGGVIFSVARAIQIDDSAEDGAYASATISNQGTIQGLGGEAIVIVGTHDDTLTNSGYIYGDITMGGGNDTVTFSRRSVVDGVVYLGEGNDSFRGSADDETVSGGAGKDELEGGKGADVFLFVAGDSAASKKNADTITDFNGKSGDVIDLSGIDADGAAAGDQAFTFIGGKAFGDNAGELRFETDKKGTWIEGDIDGNGKADFIIHLDDRMSLKADFFEL